MLDSVLWMGGALVAATPTAGLNDLINQIINSISTTPENVAIKGALTLLVVLLALTGGRWLSSAAGRVPVRVESRLRRTGGRAENVSSARTRFSAWIGRLTTVCVWLAVIIAVAFIWLFNTTLSSRDTETI